MGVVIYKVKLIFCSKNKPKIALLLANDGSIKLYIKLPQNLILVNLENGNQKGKLLAGQM